MLQSSRTKKAILLALIVLLSFFGFTLSAYAITVTWTGGGTDNLASNPANWSGGIAPQYGDDAIIDGTSIKDCTWDLTVTLASLSIKSGYSGKVTKISAVSLVIAKNFVSPTLPTATTNPATNINGNASTLNATVNPNGAETTVYFQWGTSISYGNTTSPQSIGTSTASVSADINRLSTNTTYHYRVVATNAYGTTYGSDMTFTTTGGTYIGGGTISTDTTWTFAGSPYIVDRTINVYSTTSEPTLTIEPGVEVRFRGLYYLFIGYYDSSSAKGRLNAQGTATKPIIFTSGKATPAAGDWSGIRFHNHATTESILDYVTVEYGGYYDSNIFLNSSPTIKNSTIRYSKYSGIYIVGNSSPTITGSTISNNIYGVSVGNTGDTGNVSITGSIISSNGTSGINMWGNGGGSLSLTITGSTISNNGEYGVSAMERETGSLTITGSTISNNGKYGIYTSLSVISISSNSFTNNTSYALSIPADVTNSLDTGNSFSGNGNGNGIELRGGTISTNTTWKYQGVPYIATGNIYVYSTTSEPTLTIEPGVEVRFDGAYGLYIGYYYGSNSYKGRLNAQGTSSAPIMFTSKNVSQIWSGISFRYRTATKSILEYARVEQCGSYCVLLQDSLLTIKNSTIRDSSFAGIYAGYDSSLTIIGTTISNNTYYGIQTYLGVTGNINITLSTISDNGKDGIYAGGTGSISITGSTISNNGTYGVYAENSISALSISSNSFTNNGTYHISIKPSLTLVGTGNTFSGNGNGIELRGGTISANTTWTYQSVPYIVTGYIYVYGTTSEPTLTIEPGVEVRFNGLQVVYIGYPSSYKGRLNAQGTSEKPIKFTSNKATPAAGDWYGIYFYNHASSESVLDYVTVEYGGYSISNIYLSNNSPTIKNSTIRYSKNSGINAIGDSLPVITNSTISNNTTYAVYSASPILKINHCNITGNGNGIYSPPGKIADARFNWWGDATGPSGVGTGTGQSVSSGINFEPWLGTTYSYPFHNTDLLATLQEFSPLNNSVNYTFSISENSTWTFSIKNSGGTTVRTFSGSGTSGVVTWDGKDESNVIVADGTYTYQLDSTSVSDSSQSAPFIGDVIIGEGLPKAEITYPVNGQFIGNSLLNIQGSASDTDFTSYKIEYSFGTAPETWTLIKSSTTPVTAGILAAWDVSSLTGTYYTIRLSVTDNTGNTATASVEVKLLNIYNIAVSNPYFSPNADSSKDTTTITASLTYSSNWTVDIKNSGGTVIRTLSGTGTSISATWDGKNTSGVLQPEGEYSYTITATEPSSGIVATKDSTTNITIDLTLPTAQITYPIANQDVYEIVTITGTASDAIAKDYHYLYYGSGTNPTTYTYFASGTTNVTNGTLGTWDTHDRTNGIYTLKLLVMDKAGNSIETTVPVTVSNASVSNLTASVNFNPASNQSSAINYTLAKGGLITIRVGDYYSYFRILISNAKRPAGENTDYWDGRNDLGELVPAGNYLIAIYTTTDPDPMPETAPRIKDPLASPARFDPTSDTGAAISYNLSKDAKVTVSIYDFNNNLIRNIAVNVSQITGNNSVVWNGKNSSGNYVVPGAYRFKITATDSASVTGPEVTGITQVYY